jgi:hypothetical protein
MKKLFVVLSLSLTFASQFALANPDCEARAVSKEGKPLVGAAKSAFMKKCMNDAKPTEHAECANKAVSKDGKPLHGAARSAFMKKCVAAN